MLRVLGETENVVSFQKLCGLQWTQRSGDCDCGSEKSHGSKLGPENGSKRKISDDSTSSREFEDEFRQDDGQSSRNNNGCQVNGTAGSRSDLEFCSCARDSKLVITGYNPVWHRLFEFGSGLGNEIFYITFLPFVYWNVDDFIARRLIVLWVFNMYTGQAMKDVLRWPRPASPPAYRFEHYYADEYGMPSTHAIAGAIIPFGLVYFSYGRYKFDALYGIIFFMTWTSLVCFSRVYRGMHSFQDILAGLSVAAFVTALLMPYLDVSLEIFLASPNAWIFVILIPLLMVYVFPTNCLETISDTTRIIAVGCGCMLGSWVDYYIQGIPISDPYESAPRAVIGTSLIAWSLFSASRFLIGVSILLLVKTALKATIFSIARWMAMTDEEGKMKPSESKLLPSVTVPYIFVTYGSIGFAAFYVAPRAFEFVGLIL